MSASKIARLQALLDSKLAGLEDKALTDALTAERAVYDDVLRNAPSIEFGLARLARELKLASFRQHAGIYLTALVFSTAEEENIGGCSILNALISSVLRQYPQEWFTNFENSAAVVNAIRLTTIEIRASVSNNFGPDFKLHYAK